LDFRHELQAKLYYLNRFRSRQKLIFG